MVKVLHFADAHIDMANYGRHDSETGLPVRVMDYLRSLDEIIHTAISEKVDLVIFAGDAYKDRSPAPTFQREWGRRIMQLSRAGIITLLLTGNHDISPATGRAHAIQEFDTLEVPGVCVLNAPQFLSPSDLAGLPVQILALPWISRSGMVAKLELENSNPEKIYEKLSHHVSELIDYWLENADPELPTILTAHASVEGAMYGTERMVMLGKDLVLPPALVKDARLDYVALGHIHKPQNINEGNHPPVIYPGSIERIDFGEVQDRKFFIIADVVKGATKVNWIELKNIRPFKDIHVKLESEDKINQILLAAMPPQEELDGAIVRLTINYKREWESLIQENSLRDHAANAFEFHLVKRPQMQVRARISKEQMEETFSMVDLLDLYWQAVDPDMNDDQKKTLQTLAKIIIEDVNSSE